MTGKSEQSVEIPQALRVRLRDREETNIRVWINGGVMDLHWSNCLGGLSMLYMDHCNGGAYRLPLLTLTLPKVHSDPLLISEI